jgi:glycosyltransferase involved in cell wall biosynthesis
MTELKSSHIVIITPQLPILYKNGGIGTFTLYFTQVLLAAGYHHITLIYSGHVERPRAEWQPFYRALGVNLITLHNYRQPEPTTLPGMGAMAHLSERIAQLIPNDADVIYMADFLANGLITARVRRFRPTHSPVLVTVLHGCSEWHRQGQYLWPSASDEVELDFNERYVAQHSDLVAAPSHYAIEWALHNSWRLPAARQVLGYPFIPAPELPTPNAPALTGSAFCRLIYFGRIETRKGFDLLLESLIEMAADPDDLALLSTIEEVVILGQKGVHGYGTIENAAQRFSRVLDLPLTFYTDKETFEAQSYLREHVAGSLVILPSRAETFGFTLIESAQIHGLNVIYASGSGLSEVLSNPHPQQSFEPTRKGVINALRYWLQNGTAPAEQLGTYDHLAANARWLAFHEDLCRTAQARKALPKRTLTPPVPLDIVMPHYNLGDYLPYALESLAAQTTDAFHLYLIDDGSTEPDSVAVFEQMRARYAQRPNWHFYRRENSGVCQTRNIGVALGNSPYVMFVDPDNVFPPYMVERYRDCITVSGDDLLTAWHYVFEGEGWPYVGNRTHGTLIPATGYFYPSGGALTLNLLKSSMGDNNCIFRREAFEAIGGLTTHYPNYVNQEDRELFVRFALAGYKLDVIPEILFYYRLRPQSRLRTTEQYLNEARVLRPYQDALKAHGLEDIISVMVGMHYRLLDQERTHAGRYINPDGTAFYQRDDFLANGVPWGALLGALWNKGRKTFINWQKRRLQRP